MSFRVISCAKSYAIIRLKFGKKMGQLNKNLTVYLDTAISNNKCLDMIHP